MRRKKVTATLPWFLALALMLLCLAPLGSAMHNFDADTPEAGLLIATGGGDNNPIKCAMRSMAIEGTIIDGIAEVKMTQEFHVGSLDSKLPTAAYYQLPLDEQAAVTKFQATIGDRVVEAKVKERGEARREFDEAVQEGMGAYLAEQTRADIFRIGVGNLPENETVRITLVYITPLEAVGSDTARFVLPTAIAPRYEPMENSEGMIPDDEPLIDKGVKVNLTAFTGSILKSIESSTHDISVKRDTASGRALVQVVDKDPLVRDIVINVRTETDHQPQVYVEQTSNSSAAIMVSLVPEMPKIDSSADEPKSEFIFVVDRSGSMYWDAKIKNTQRALKQILSRLPQGSLFNIVGFGSDFEYVFPNGSRKVSDGEAMRDAISYIDSISDYDMGGSEILRPLRSVLQSSKSPSYDRVLFVLTDGQVSNTVDTIKYVIEERSDTRVFALGIGDHVSRLLVQGIARSGAGTAEFVDGDSVHEIRNAIERQMPVACAPALEDIKVEFLPRSMEKEPLQAPCVPPPLLSGKTFRMFFLLEDGELLPEQLRVTARSSATGSLVQYTVNVTSISQMKTTDMLIHKMAARELVRDLEEGLSTMHGSYASYADIERDIADLGVKFQIASSQTSFVAVDNNGWIEEKGAAAVTAQYGGDRVQALRGSTEGGDATSEILLLDVCPLSLGFDAERSGHVTKVITRGTTIPTKKKVTFHPHHLENDESIIEIRIFEGERPLAKDNHLLGMLELIVDQNTEGGEIEMSFEVDANGILQVFAEDKGTGKAENITITSEKGRLSEEEIERMVLEADKYAHSDNKLKENFDARNDLESYLHSLMPLLKDDNDNMVTNISAEDKKQLRDMIDDILDWIGSNLDADKEIYAEKQKLAVMASNRILQQAKYSINDRSKSLVEDNEL